MDSDQYFKNRTSRPISKDLAFAESEFRRRIEEVRKVMDKEDLDALLITYPPNLSYLSGYQSFGSGWYTCMILPREGEPILHMHQLEVGPAILTCWVPDIRGVRWAQEGEADALVGIVKERKLEGKRIGIEPKRPGLTLGLYEGLKHGLP
ncbi:aminopeptidase P family N-terminal domain-containing protein, partial [Mesorhizobium sp.]|uniref:aminopeptidase P family N-terminal domain-containing protein n=1 Tax=Mesorhizobium sp. TaxID=1871066 RepID=UPI000FE7A9B2